MLKRYYKLLLAQTSPLHLSNGDSQDTDSDLMKDSRNMPFIPGTGLIGVLRNMLTEDEGNRLFGWVDGEKQQGSRVIGSDAVLPSEAGEKDIHLSYRDGVSLDPIRGTAVKGAKFDLETVETTLPYQSVLEWTGEESDESLSILDRLIAQVVASGLSLGGKVTRGYGAMKVTAWKRDFHFPEALQEWLDFQPGEKETDCWQPVSGMAADTKTKDYEISFRVSGPIAVRVYSTENGKADFVPLKNVRSRPVIPGTSWAGSFRHRMLEIAGELSLSEEQKDAINAFFGKMKDGMQRSAISFSETEIEGGKPLEVTRNALDRFTGGPAMTALFTAGYWYGGEGSVKIRLEKKSLSPLLEQLLLAALRDLDLGLMTVGGSASTGLGQLRITKMTVNGEPYELRAEVKEG